MSYKTIGKNTPYVSAIDKVTGRAKYTDDIRLHNPLHIKILRSPHTAALIESISLDEAQSMTGVKAVICGEDLSKCFGVLPISRDEPAMAKERVRYVGEPIAAVAAESLEIAQKALETIKVEFKKTEAVLNSTAAMKDTSDPIHVNKRRTNNVHKAVDQNFGDIEEGFSESDATVCGKFKFKSVTHAFMEPHATQVEISGSGDITVHTATQVPHYVHRAISETLEIPMHKIRVVKPFLGGGFGGKSDPFPHEMIAVKLALLTNRNTRVCFSREEVFLSHHGRHETEVEMRLGVSKTKGVRALDARMLIDGGAYGSFGVVTTYYNGVLLNGPYELPNYHFHCDRTYTNKPMCGAMRGHGGVNPRFAVEVLYDRACEELKLDPCEARLSMFLKENSLTANEFRITSSGIDAGLKAAMAKCEWQAKHRKLPYGKGIGVAAGFFISGSALPIHWNEMPQSTVRLSIDYDGGVVIYSGASDIGQGSDTMLAQMVSEVLGLPMSMMKVVSADTRLCPIDYGSYSSRVTFMAGNAARNAAIRMRRTLVKACCQLMKIPEPHYETPKAPESFFRQGGRSPDFEQTYLGSNPNYQKDGFEFANESITSPDGAKAAYLDVVRRGMDFHGALQSRGVYISPKMGGTFKGAGAGLSPSYSFSAFISEVNVDPLTGMVKVERVTATHDCGFELNPMAVEGQLEGSIHMGLGQALMERIDHRNGVVQNASFLNYKIPSAFETPEIDIIRTESDESEGPFGAKEVGEGALAPLAPSVANAIYDAVGVRLENLPMTPEDIYKGILKTKVDNQQGWGS